jgi:hypothetical protein
MRQTFLVALLLLWCLVMGERSAYAYVDPNGGSMLLQLVLGGAAGIALIAKLYWQRLLSLLGLRRHDASRKDQPTL